MALGLVFAAGCSSAEYKRQEYAKLSDAKVFESEFPAVWKGIVAAVGEYRLLDNDAEDGKVRTDWIYSTSNEKYVDYQVNGLPRKHYLQTRYKFDIRAEKQMGGVKVTVNTKEEVEALKSDGTFDQWRSVSEPDTSRANDMLKSIELKILSAN